MDAATGACQSERNAPLSRAVIAAFEDDRAQSSADRRACMAGGTMPGAVTYWKEGKRVQNMGDFLTELLLARVQVPGSEFYPRMRLIGSVISEPLIRNDLAAAGSADAMAGYWGCGQRDEYPIDPKLRRRCRFHGVRGPLTRSRLELPANTTIGDPALLLPLLYTPRAVPELATATLCVPHFFDATAEKRILEQTGADFVLRPNIPATMDALLRMIDMISAAEFVLAGALHAAIIACAYRKPFAFYIENYIDLPFKWLDFSASVDIPAVFARSVPEGRRAWQTLLAPVLRRPALAPILTEYPGVVQPGLLEKAIDWDRDNG